MIKGINRQVVEVNDTGNECFEKILFFIKPEYAGMSEGKIRERAGLIAKGTPSAPPSKVKKSKLNEIMKLAVCLFAGLIAGIAVTLIMK